MGFTVRNSDIENCQPHPLKLFSKLRMYSYEMYSTRRLNQNLLFGLKIWIMLSGFNTFQQKNDFPFFVLKKQLWGVINDCVGKLSVPTGATRILNVRIYLFSCSVACRVVCYPALGTKIVMKEKGSYSKRDVNKQFVSVYPEDHRKQMV